MTSEEKDMKQQTKLPLEEETQGESVKAEIVVDSAETVAVKVADTSEGKKTQSKPKEVKAKSTKSKTATKVTTETATETEKVADKPLTKEEYVKIEKEISELKKQLREVGDIKEDFFQKKKGLKEQLIAFNKELKELRSKPEDGEEESTDTAASFDNLKVLKKSLGDLNAVIRTKINEFKKLNEEKGKIFKDEKINYKEIYNVGNIQKSIDELDYKIETEALPFKKEQEIMRKIKELKRSRGSNVKGAEILISMKTLSKEIDKLKAESMGYRSQLDSIYDNLGSQREEFKKKLSEIKEVRTLEKGAHHNFLKQKVKYTKLKEELGNKYSIIKNVRDTQRDERKKKEKAKRKKLESEMKEKQKALEQKFKEKKKLTTEDLLQFQGF